MNNNNLSEPFNVNDNYCVLIYVLSIPGNKLKHSITFVHTFTLHVRIIFYLYFMFHNFTLKELCQEI